MITGNDLREKYKSNGGILIDLHIANRELVDHIATIMDSREWSLNYVITNMIAHHLVASTKEMEADGQIVKLEDYGGENV